MVQRRKLLRPGRFEAAGLDQGGWYRALDVVRRTVDAGGVPGAVVAVGRCGHLFGPQAFGWRQLEPERAPVAVDTLYDLASVTKVTATLPVTLALIDQGRLRLDDPVVEFIPEFASGTREGPLAAARERVRLRHLLTHTSGLPAWRDLYSTARSPADVIEQICQTPLERPPGERVTYSCLGFILLGEILQRVLGRSLAQAADELVFGPLGMTNTMFRPPPDRRQNIAATERRGEEGDCLVGEVHDENARAMGGISGNAGLFGTAADLAVYCQMWLNGGAYAGQRVLSEAVTELAVRPHTASLNACRGLGWVVKGDDPFSSAGDMFAPEAFGHTGFTGTSIWIDPRRELIAVLLTNRVHPTRQNQAHIRLRALFHNALAAACEA
ncbi:MAG TPA: serine hydrolase domain-containing protein [Limnochordia bacterium]